MAVQKIITTLYSWFPAPHTTDLNSTDSWIYDRVGGFNIGTQHRAWWKTMVADLYWAGVNGAFIGNAYPVTDDDREANEQKFTMLSRAIKVLKVPFTVGVIVEKASRTVLEQYDDIIEPFYDSVPKSRWLRHRDDGTGKPMIYIWASKITTVTQYNTDLATLKTRFLEDFGETPFLCFEPNSSYQAITNFALVDSLIQWNAPIGGHIQHNWNGYKVSSIGPGNNEQLIRPWRCYGSSPSNPGYNPLDPVENHVLRGDLGDPAKFMKDEWAKISTPVDVVFWQDAGELNEGTYILRASNYPTPENPIFSSHAEYVHGDPQYGTIAHVRQMYKAFDRGWYLPEDYYLNVLQALIRASFPDNVTVGNVKSVPALRDSQFLSWSVPTSVTHDTTFRVTISFRNLGIQSWRRDLSYKLASKNPDLNTTWGDDKKQLEGNETVLKNGSKLWNIGCRAPVTSGSYNFQWQMFREMIGFFGAATPNQVIQVI